MNPWPLDPLKPDYYPTILKKNVAPEDVIEAAAVNTIKLYGDRIIP